MSATTPPPTDRVTRPASPDIGALGSHPSRDNGLVGDLAALVSGYWENYRLVSSSDRTDGLRADDYHWAWEEVDYRVSVNPTEVTDLLVALADEAPDDAALAYLGAGPVEDLLVYHGSDFVFDAVEGAARRNERFCKALRCAWYDDCVPAAVATRLRAFGRPY